MRTMCLVYNILVIAAISSACEAARILAVFPTPSISHQVAFRPLTLELARRGHEVVIITPDPAYPAGETPENISEIDVHDTSYKMWREAVVTGSKTSGRAADGMIQQHTIVPLLSKLFEIQMRTEQVQRLINNKTNHFDMILAEASIRPATSFSYVFNNAPVVYVSSFLGLMGNYDVMGAPRRTYLLYPNVLRQRIYNMSMWEKVEEIYNQYLFERLFSYVEGLDDMVVKRLFGPETPSIRELENNVHLLLINCHPIWDGNRPVPPTVIYMGGIHQKPPKKLPEDLKSYLDNSKHGVIYVSFGTNVDPAALPPERIQLLLNVFSKLPYDVLWKWSKDEMPGKPANIRIAKWLPQSDLLKHPNIKLFIMQGGLQSTDEAITAGVPLIGMPMLGDQWYNVEQFVYHKIGLRMDLEFLTEESFLNGIHTVINDASYRNNVERLRNIMLDQTDKPLNRAMFWIEHILRHGGATHLRARVANMSWAEYLDTELMAVLALAFTTVILAISVILYVIIGYVKKYLSTGTKLKSN